ncbi:MULTISPECIES: ABC transporter permease [Paraburkholderia]|jgi:putative spermidine/putrescine transport system permease protein|uniref:Putative spermidine/putrescine transport system permease protein n=1 Tax=Paraburkholderia terricola TaxID=169427 RepID=A0A1M6VP92_9BURK|nr:MULTISPECIES: ABC transporter permease [Paraburkholderia]AXE96787.1 ABC transporter permease [Paraburkholderia terricola]ORC45784.1 ABC transporter permease [Burkholderia sp. A27]SDP07771.1 putative spermidine/putrescine transport system permease protein [Paraburkholderia sediminicola]SHK83056.1 putative spermidine/putrescine transport system permease protein [Paraburkholderia terricola]
MTAMLARFSRRAGSASNAARGSAAASGSAAGAVGGTPSPASAAPDQPAASALDKARPWLLLAPILTFLAVLGAAALVVLRMSFGTQGDEWRGFTLQNYADLLDGYFLKSLWLTLKLAFQSMICAIVLAIPVALAMARTQSRLARRLLLAGVLLPLLVNLLLQGYGWLIILGPAGLLNHALLGSGLVQRPVMWLYREHGVLLGLIQTAFPLAVLPLSSAMRAVSRSYEEAAATLGATRWQTLRHILLPLALPGLVSGALLVFAYNASAFAVPLLLGGRRVPMLAVLVHDQVAPLLNWPAASASGVVLMLATLTVMALSQRLVRRTQRLAEEPRA